jgi:hypothetical protein
MPFARFAPCTATAVFAAAMLSAPLSSHAAPNGKPQTLHAHRLPHQAAPPGLPLATEHPNAPAGLAQPYSGTPIDVLTYHYDQGRSGWNQAETDLTAATVGSSKFGLLKTLKVDGNVFAQPLMVSNFTMPDGSTHNVLVVATGHNTVYAYDAQSYAVLWKVNLGTPQSTSDVGCSDVRPEYGIASTPVIQRTGAGAATIFVVSATEPTRFQFQTQLHALDLGTGKDITTPATIAPSAKIAGGQTISFNPQNQWSRAGLAMANNAITISIGSHCDNDSGSISGWLLQYSTALAPLTAFHTIEHSSGLELASVWMSGFAPALDASGNVFAVTGNGEFDGRHDYGESVLSLSPTLGKVLSTFTPAAYQTLNANDLDFASGGVMLIPPVAGQTAPPLAATMGKDAVLYLLDQTKLGGEKPNDKGALQAQRIGTSGSGTRGGPAFFNGAAGPLVYLQIDSDVLRAFTLTAGSKPALTLAYKGTTQAGYGGSTPIVSSNAAAAGTGVVWLIRRSSPLELEAYDASKLGAPIFAAGSGTWSNPSGNAFLTPLEANGRVYVPAYKTVSVFGLTP